MLFLDDDFLSIPLDDPRGQDDFDDLAPLREFAGAGWATFENGELVGPITRQRGNALQSLLRIAQEHAREEKAKRLEKLQEALRLYVNLKGLCEWAVEYECLVYQAIQANKKPLDVEYHAAAIEGNKKIIALRAEYLAKKIAELKILYGVKTAIAENAEG